MSYSNITNPEVAADAALTTGLMTKLRDNPEAIALGLSGATRVTEAGLETGAVHQNQLDTTTQDIDLTASVNNASSYGTFLMTSAQYFLGFKYGSPDTSSSSASVYCSVQTGRAQTNFNTENCYGEVGVADTGAYTDLTVESEWRYVTASGPFDLGDGEIPTFIFVLMRDGKPRMVSACDIPPWAYNGPTEITPTRVFRSENGSLKKYKTVVNINDDGEIERKEVEINMEMKNRDINLLPQPFIKEPGDEVILIDPVETLQLKELRTGGLKFSSLLFKDYIRLDNTPIKRKSPNGVRPTRYKWKNTRRKAGEMMADRRQGVGAFSKKIVDV